MTRSLPVIGTLIVLSSTLFFAATHVFVKALGGEVHLYHVIFFRNLFGALVLAGLWSIKPHLFTFKRPGLLLFRCVLGLIAMGVYFKALETGDIGRVNLVFNFSVLWAFFLGIVFFKERPSLHSIIAVPVALMGLAFILNPSFGNVGLPEGLALIGSVAVAAVTLTIKQLRITNSSVSIVFAFHAFALLMTTPYTLMNLPSPTTVQWGLLIGSGVMGLMAQQLMTMGLKFSSASISSALLLFTTPLLYVSGSVFFGEPITWATGLGMMVVVGALGVIAVKR